MTWERNFAGNLAFHAFRVGQWARGEAELRRVLEDDMEPADGLVSFNNLISFDALQINFDEKVAAVNGKTIDLTKKEFDLLLYFIENKNRVISKSAIAEHLWGDNMDLGGNYDFIYTHIKNLRKKLIQGGAADYIKSIYGMGYKFTT